MPETRRVVFLDRDGTINEEVDDLRRPEDVRLTPGAALAIKRLNQAGFAVVVVSNQSGLARGVFDEMDLAAVQREINRLLSLEGAQVDAYYFCPHHPEGIVECYSLLCDCRKPLPGLIYQAVEELNLNLNGSYLIGDRLRDVASGLAAGLTSIMVRSGQTDPPPTGPHEEPHIILDNLAQAVDWILQREGK